MEVEGGKRVGGGGRKRGEKGEEGRDEWLGGWVGRLWVGGPRGREGGRELCGGK